MTVQQEAPKTRLVRVSASAKLWLEKRQAEQQARLGRLVTFAEIIDEVLALWQPVKREPKP